MIGEDELFVDTFALGANIFCYCVLLFKFQYRRNGHKNHGKTAKKYYGEVDEKEIEPWAFLFLRHHTEGARHVDDHKEQQQEAQDKKECEGIDLAPDFFRVKRFSGLHESLHIAHLILVLIELCHVAPVEWPIVLVLVFRNKGISTIHLVREITFLTGKDDSTVLVGEFWR